jgi:hypothetical protein
MTSMTLTHELPVQFVAAMLEGSAMVAVEEDSDGFR